MVETDEGSVDYRRGDQVLITRNDHARGLLNGTTAIVTDLRGDGLTLTTGRGQQVTVDRAWLAEGRLDHGYAMTLHKAQGRTVNTALLVGTDSLSHQAGYVGLSRGTHANHLFLTTADRHHLATDCSTPVQHRPGVRVAGKAPLTRDSRRLLGLDHGRDDRQGRAIA